MRTWGHAEWSVFGRRARRITKLVLSVALVWMAAAHVVVWHAALGRMHTATAPPPAMYAAIVLGALVRSDRSLSNTVEDRVQCAVDLYRKHIVRRVLVTGARNEVDAMSEALIARGVSEAHVFVDSAGLRTLDSMHRAREVFGVTEAVVCTQRFHMPRALYLAWAFGVNAVGSISDRRVYATATYDWLRERLATARAMFDVWSGQESRFLGEKHSITGDGRTTHEKLLVR